MSLKNSQTAHNGYKSNSSVSGPKWREANQCNTDCRPVDPDPKTCEIIREKDSKETWFLVNTEQSNHKQSESISKLTWILLGLATLLFLGSMLSNLLMVWTLARSTNNTNNSREVIETTTTKEEVIRVVQDPGYWLEEYYYYAPAARW